MGNQFIFNIVESDPLLVKKILVKENNAYNMYNFNTPSIIYIAIYNTCSITKVTLK